MENGMTIKWFDRLDSTNSELLRHIDEYDNLSVVAAVEQFAGRGQRGNRWLSRPGDNLTFSLLLKPRDLPAAEFMSLTFMATLAVRSWLEDQGVSASIKWPNDILFDGRKLVGILTEMTGEMGKIYYIVVGVGINVNINREDFPEEIRDIAASLSEMNGEEISRVKIFRAVLEELDKLYREVNANGFGEVFKLWRKYNVTLDKNIRVISVIDGNDFTGKAVDLNEDGALVVETPDGLRTVYAGDVSIR